jgi:hypothetical protein
MNIIINILISLIISILICYIINVKWEQFKLVDIGYYDKIKK